MAPAEQIEHEGLHCGSNAIPSAQSVNPISTCWKHVGGCLETHQQMGGEHGGRVSEMVCWWLPGGLLVSRADLLVVAFRGRPRHCDRTRRSSCRGGPGGPGGHGCIGRRGPHCLFGTILGNGAWLPGFRIDSSKELKQSSIQFKTGSVKLCKMGGLAGRVA